MAASDQELSKYVTLISSDGFEFVVLREAACISGAIKRMLDPKSTYSTFPIPPRTDDGTS
jgi:elongin-C